VCGHSEHPCRCVLATEAVLQYSLRRACPALGTSDLAGPLGSLTLLAWPLTLVAAERLLKVTLADYQGCLTVGGRGLFSNTKGLGRAGPLPLLRTQRGARTGRVARGPVFPLCLGLGLPLLLTLLLGGRSGGGGAGGSPRGWGFPGTAFPDGLMTPPTHLRLPGVGRLETRHWGAGEGRHRTKDPLGLPAPQWLRAWQQSHVSSLWVTPNLVCQPLFLITSFIDFARKK
jgi:hypothetical protein